MLEQIEALYGPASRAPTPTVTAEGTERPRTRRGGLGGSALRTLLFASAAFLAWYALAGGEASVQHTFERLVAATREQRGVIEATPTPEYTLALRTMRVDRLDQDDPLVLQFKALLDKLAPKCQESRAQLASVVIDVYAAKVSRGVETPYLTILAQADEFLSEQTRSQWPTSCGDVMGRL